MPTVRLVVWVVWPEEPVAPALALPELEHDAVQTASAATATAAAPSRVTRVEVG
jgi:hypothetical protein